MFPTAINKRGSLQIDCEYLLTNSASASETRLKLDSPSWSGNSKVYVDIDSFLDEFIFERDLSKNMMIASEKSLLEIWNTPEEDEAWQDL